MISFSKMKLVFLFFVVAITLGVAFLVIPPPYAATFFATLGFIVFAESLVLLIPLDFQSETWMTQSFFIGSGAVVYAVLVAVTALLGVFGLAFNWLLAGQLLILLVPGFGMACAAVMQKRIHSAVWNLEKRRMLYEELQSKASLFAVALKQRGKSDFERIFSPLREKMAAMTKETYPKSEAATRAIMSEFEAVANEVDVMNAEDFTRKVKTICELVEQREVTSRSLSR